MDKELLEKITAVIDLNIRPSLQMDGGDISIVSFEDNILKVILQGACHRCPRAAETLKFGVEKTLREKVSPNIIVMAV